MKSYKFVVYGRVQGVFYRKTVASNARKSGFVGYVKNLPDKTVEACVNCEDQEVAEFKKILEKGSPMSKVDSIKQMECFESFGADFEIR